MELFFRSALYRVTYLKTKLHFYVFFANKIVLMVDVIEDRKIT